MNVETTQIASQYNHHDVNSLSTKKKSLVLCSDAVFQWPSLKRW